MRENTARDFLEDRNAQRAAAFQADTAVAGTVSADNAAPRDPAHGQCIVPAAERCANKTRFFEKLAFFIKYIYSN